MHYQRESELLDKIRIIAASVSGGKYALPTTTRAAVSTRRTVAKKNTVRTNVSAGTFVNSRRIKSEKLWSAVSGNGRDKGGLAVGTIRETLSQNGIDTSSMLRKNAEQELAKLLRKFNIPDTRPQKPPKLMMLQSDSDNDDDEQNEQNDDVIILSALPKNKAEVAKLIAQKILKVGDKYTSSGSSKTFQVLDKQGKKRQIN